jgi:trehalose/maltose transport system substrate-binding protein
VQALTLLHKLATSGLTSSSLSNAQEPEVFADLQAGRSAFSLNWPYVLASMKEANPALVPNLGYAPYPTVTDGAPVTTTLGGMNFAISTYSKHPDEAFDAAMCLRSPEHQLQHAINAGEPPTNRTVYDQPEMKEAYPMADVMLTELENAKPRPISPVYQNISTVLSTTLSPPADIQPQASADQLSSAIQNAIEGKGILP